MKTLDKMYKALTKVETWFVFAIFFFATVATVINIISRKLFGVSFNWIDELSRYIMLITTCIGMSVAISNDGHPRMDLLHRTLKGKARKVIVFIADLILAAILIIGAYYAIQQGINTFVNGAKTSTLPLKLWVFFMFIPLGFTGASIRSIILVYYDFLDLLGKDPRKAAVTAGEEAMIQ